MSAEIEPAILESDVPLSQSIIWRMQRDFYAQRGLRAWTEDMVPQYITNNPFIAEVYARIVFGFMSDCGSRPGAPLHIVELGAGPGKFSWLFLRHLTAMMRTGNIPIETACYRMTDDAPSLLKAWRANRRLAEFVESGVLHFEQFTAGGQASAEIASGGPPGPLVVIANYVFDSLPQDAFVIEQDRLLEAVVTTTSTGGSRPDKLSDLRMSWRNVTVPPDRYPVPAWNEILEQYRSRLSGTTVLFPAEALKTLRQMASLSDGRMLVLAADKGCTQEETLRLAQGPPVIELHASGNCFSQMVNFDAIGRYFEAIGGRALLPGKYSASVDICAFLQGLKEDQFNLTTTAYQETQSAFGPDELFALLGWLDPHMDAMSIPQILAVLRLSHWDPVALMRLFPAITRQVRSVTNARHDFRNAVLSTWANHFPVTPGENAMAFQCGVILLELRFFEDALPMFQASQQALGPSAPTSFNLGLCCIGLGRTSEALAFMIEACDLDPGFEPAKSARARLEAGESGRSQAN